MRLITINKNQLTGNQEGFTLVELLIVIAVLGVLATVILVAINPLEQFARTRDAGRKTSMSSIGNALQTYYTSHNATGLSDQSGVLAGTWASLLVTSGDLSQIPINSAQTGTNQTQCNGATYFWTFPACPANTQCGYGASPGSPSNISAQAGTSGGNWCYYFERNTTTGVVNSVAFVAMESGAETSKCRSVRGNGASAITVFSVWSANSQAGDMCVDTAAAATFAGLSTQDPNNPPTVFAQ